MMIRRDTIDKMRDVLRAVESMRGDPTPHEIGVLQAVATIARIYLDCDLTPDEVPVEAVETCPHGETIGECNACDMQADFAYDAAREARMFGGGR